jgi:hypothetical protein
VASGSAGVAAPPPVTQVEAPCLRRRGRLRRVRRRRRRGRRRRRRFALALASPSPPGGGLGRGVRVRRRRRRRRRCGCQCRCQCLRCYCCCCCCLSAGKHPSSVLPSLLRSFPRSLPRTPVRPCVATPSWGRPGREAPPVALGVPPAARSPAARRPCGGRGLVRRVALLALAVRLQRVRRAVSVPTAVSRAQLRCARPPLGSRRSLLPFYRWPVHLSRAHFAARRPRGQGQRGAPRTFLV